MLQRSMQRPHLLTFYLAPGPRTLDPNFMSRVGSLIVISGPSGSGKTTLAASAIAGVPNLKFSISYTTRQPRTGEREGFEYFFVTENQFQQMRDDGEFIEWAVVHGNFYGTSKKIIADSLGRGEDIILDIDVQGAARLKQEFPDAVLVFIFPPSFEELRKRLLQRGLDTTTSIEKRLEIAKRETLQYSKYDYIIINDDLESSKQELISIISAARCRNHVRCHAAEEILQTFH